MLPSPIEFNIYSDEDWEKYYCQNPLNFNDEGIKHTLAFQEQTYIVHSRVIFSSDYLSSKLPSDDSNKKLSIQPKYCKDLKTFDILMQILYGCPKVKCPKDHGADIIAICIELGN